jgi:hypothetical protein
MCRGLVGGEGDAAAQGALHNSQRQSRVVVTAGLCACLPTLCLQSAAAHRLHPEESEVAALVRRRVAADMGGPQAEELADAIIEVRWGSQAAGGLAVGRARGQAGRLLDGICSSSCSEVGTHQRCKAASVSLQAAEARAARQPLGKRPHTVEEVLMAGGGSAGLSVGSLAPPAAAAGCYSCCQLSLLLLPVIPNSRALTDPTSPAPLLLLPLLHSC